MGDLFNVEWTSGDMTVSSVEFISKYVGMFAVIVISIVGFGIVMASILKNATHGLYAVSPKFWDRVDEVKKVELRGLNSAGRQRVAPGNNEVMKLIGTGMAVLLSLLPNIKAMTDFDDEVLDAKAYFMKAIPLMCLHIFIGVFIFFGFPAQVAQKASEFGTGLFDVVLTNVDPSAWVEELPDKLAVLKFSTDGAKNDTDKAINTAAKKVTTTYLGAVPSVTKEKRLEVALSIESWVASNMNGLEDYCNPDKYDMEVTATVYKFGNDPKESVERVYNQTSNGVTTYAWYTDFSKFEPKGTEDVSDWFIRYDLIFTAVASSGKGDSAADTKMTVRITTNANGEKATADLGSGGYVKSGSSCGGTAVLNNTDEQIDVNIEVNGGTLTIIPKASKDKTALAGNGISYITNVSRLSYSVTGFTAKIREIVADGSASVPTFEDSSTGKNWKFGDSPSAEE